METLAFPLGGGEVHCAFPANLSGGEDVAVERDYDLFKQLPDSSPMWRGRVSGLHETRRKLQEVSKATTNECFAMHLPTREIAARVNVRTASGKKPVVFQITYDYKLVNARTEILKLHGYEVVSAIGNEAAKVVLSIPRECDLFIVGHAAPEEIRREIVEWYRRKLPRRSDTRLEFSIDPRVDGRRLQRETERTRDPLAGNRKRLRRGWPERNFDNWLRPPGCPISQFFSGSSNTQISAP